MTSDETADFNDLCLALRQRRDPYRAFGRIHTSRHLGAIPKNARPRMPLRLRRRRARHARDAARQGQKNRPRNIAGADAKISQARLRRLCGRIRQLPHDSFRGKPRFVGADLSRAQRQRADCAARDRAVVRSGQKNVSARPLRARRLPSLRRARSIRRFVRKMRRRLFADRTQKPALDGVGRASGAALLRAFVFSLARSHRFDRRMGARRSRRRRRKKAAPATASGEQTARVARFRLARLGYFARRALLRLSHSGRGGGKIFLCVARRAHRLYGEFSKPVRARQEDRFRRFLAQRKDRVVSFYRQGHFVFSRLVFGRRCSRKAAIGRRRAFSRTDF